MSSMLPGDSNNKNKLKPEQFRDFFKTMNDFLHEKPVKGFLQSIDEFFNSPFPGSGFHVDMQETGNEYIITAEMPGIKREQIHVNILNHSLTISVENNEIETKEDQSNHIFQRRVSRQQMSRTITLPHKINENQVKASYRDGLLQIRIPQEKGRIINIEE